MTLPFRASTKKDPTRVKPAPSSGFSFAPPSCPAEDSGFGKGGAFEFSFLSTSPVASDDDNDSDTDDDADPEEKNG